VGILLSLHAGLFRVLQLYFVALFIAAVLSLVFVVLSPGTAIWHTGEWQGLFNHKNSLGGAMGTLMTIGVCLFLQGWRRGFTAAVTAFGAGMLAMSRSGAALVTVAIAMSMIIPVLIYRQGYSAFFFAVGALLAAGAAALLYVDAARIDVLDAVLESLGKDATLTGRTVLWDFGVEAFQERPLLGWGYHAWWEASGPAVETLRMVIKQELWMFHNNFLEVAVAFGILGPIALGAAILFVLVTSVRTFLADPQYINAWPMFFLVLVLIQAMAENPLFNNHGLNEVLLVAIASSAVRRQALERRHEAEPAPARPAVLAGG
jgi:O-antigen ligase